MIPLSIALAAAAALIPASDAGRIRATQAWHHDFHCVRDGGGQALAWSNDSAPIGGVVVVQLVRDGGKRLDQQVLRLEAPWPRGERRAVGAMAPVDGCIVNGTWTTPPRPIARSPGPRVSPPIHVSPKIVPGPSGPVH